MSPLPSPAPASDGSWPVLHAVVDAALDPAVFPALCRAGPDAVVVPLFDGDAARELATVAPYLVELEPGTAFARHLLEDLLPSPPLLFWTAAPLSEVRAHFRRLIRVRTQAGGTLLFRFFDPSVLRALLPCLEPMQVQQVFGPVEMFVVDTGAGFEPLTVSTLVEPSGRAGLVLSDAQLDRFAAGLEDDFVDRLMAAARADLPEETGGIADWVLRRTVVASVEDAMSFDLEDEGSIASFVGLALQHGPAFHEHALVTAVLMDEAAEADRMEALVAGLSPEDWAEIEAYGRTVEDVG